MPACCVLTTHGQMNGQTSRAQRISYTDKQTRTHTPAAARRHTIAHARMHEHARMHTHARTHETRTTLKHAHTLSHTHAHTQTHTNLHARVPTHTVTHARARTHTHTCAMMRHDTRRGRIKIGSNLSVVIGMKRRIWSNIMWSNQHTVPSKYGQGRWDLFEVGHKVLVEEVGVVGSVGQGQQNAAARLCRPLELELKLLHLVLT